MSFRVYGKLVALSGVFKTTAIAFIATLAFAIYDFTLPIFTENRAESFAIVGIIVSLVYVASLLLEIPVGLAVDKYGRINILLLAMTVLGLIGLVYFFVENLILVAILSLIFGMFAVAFWIPSAVLVRDFSPRKMLGQAQGVYMSLTQVGWIFGPIVAGTIATFFSDKHNFLLVWVLMFAAVGVGLAIFRGLKAKKFTKEEKGHKHKARLALLAIILKEFLGIHKYAPPLYTLTLIVYMWIAIEWAFVPLAGITRFAFSEAGVGLVLGAMMAIEGALYYSSGFVMDKVGKRYIITAGFLILFTSAYFMFLSTNPTVFVLSALFAAAAVSWILLTEILPANLYGEMSGVFDTSKDFGLIVGPFAGGLFATYLANPLAPFLIVTIAAGIAALLAGWAFWPEKAKRK
ncbi:MAG: MFS transporter [Candidatus Nanoarchaeia archaeon]